MQIVSTRNYLLSGVLFVVLIGTALMISLSGCGRSSAYTRATETLSVELEPKDYRWIKYVKGKDCVGRYLVFFRFTSPSPIAASSNAMSQAPEANFLINRHTKIREEMWVPFVYHKICTYVEGAAVKLRDASMREAGRS